MSSIFVVKIVYSVKVSSQLECTIDTCKTRKTRVERCTHSILNVVHRCLKADSRSRMTET